MDFNKLIAGIAGSGLMSGLAGGVAGGALGSALMSKEGRKFASKAAAVGGIAAVGGLAWKAWQGYQDSQSSTRRNEFAGEKAASRSAGSGAASYWQGLSKNGFDTEPADVYREPRGLVLIRAMISAAHADGHIDGDERKRIFAKVQTLELSGEEKSLLFDELSAPAGLEKVLTNVDGPETAIEVYVASLMAIDYTSIQGREYLQELARRLQLPGPLLEEIHSQRESHVAAA